MTTVTMTNAAICTHKLLANPGLLLACVFIWSPSSRIIAPRASGSSCVLDRHETLRCITGTLRRKCCSDLSNDSVEHPSRGCFAIESCLWSGIIDIVALTFALEVSVDLQ